MDGVIVAKRATLISHLRNIVLTPFILFFAIICLKIWMLPVIFLSLGGLWEKHGGAAISAPSFEQIVIFGGIVIFLWVVASFLSLADHFRYAGWMTVGEKPYEAILISFTKTFLQADWSALLELCSDEFRLQMDRKTFRNYARRCESVLGDSRLELTLDEPGFFRLPILAKAVPLLAEYRDDRTVAIALVLFHDPCEELDRHHVKTLRLRLSRNGKDLRVDAFDIVQVALNQ